MKKSCRRRVPSRPSLIIMVFVVLVLIRTSYLFGPRDLGIRRPLPLGIFDLRPAPDIVTLPTQHTQRLLFTHTKWVVITSIKDPTEQIKNLSRIPGWKLLVVADSSTPVKWTLPNNSIILTTKMQLDLGYQITKLLPWNSYTRKIIGYLYAIEHGAKFIFDTDDNNNPDDVENFEKYFDLKRATRGLVLNNKGMMTANPYEHFGQPTMWPRGYPPQYISEPSNNSYEYTACQMATPLIQQGLVNGDPDVDAMFRLTQRKVRSSLNIQFDGSAPPLILPRSVFAPFNSLSTVFHYKAFWAMLLPVSVDSHVRDIWRGYWAQRLLWEIGSHLGFYSAHTTQHRNPHVFIRDFWEEDRIYKQSGGLIRLLKSWRCSQQDLYNCMIEVTTILAKHNLWARSEIELVKAWISDLVSIGYRRPGFRPRDSPCLVDELKTFALFTGIEIKPKENVRNFLRQFCNLPTITDKNSLQPVEFPNTLLVVTFNFPNYKSIWLLDSIYRPHYPNIVYCGNFYNSSIHAELLASEPFLDASVKGFSFVRANVSEGIFSYECALRAIDMNYGVNGYLILSDDVLLNFWNNRNKNLGEAWSTETIRNPDWFWWNTSYGLNATELSLAQIYDIPNNDFVLEFRAKREMYGYNVTNIVFGPADIFYFPKTKQEMFYEVGSILRKNEVFFEIAVHTIMTGLSSPKNRVILVGMNTSGFVPLNFFNTSNNYLHPVELEQVISNETIKVYYCHYGTRVLDFSERNQSTSLNRTY